MGKVCLLRCKKIPVCNDIRDDATETYPDALHWCSIGDNASAVGYNAYRCYVGASFQA